MDANMKRKRRLKIALAVIVAIVAVVVLAYFFLVKPAMEERALRQAKWEQHIKAGNEFAAYQAKGAKEAAEKAAELARIQELATVGKGEGVEHAFIRQLIDNPGIVSGVEVKIGKRKYDLTYSGESSDKKAVKKWAQSTAHLLAITAGYIDKKTDRQIRIKKFSIVAFVPKVNNGKLAVDIYQKEFKAAPDGKKATEAKFGNQPIYSIGGLGVDRQATFWADVKDGVSSFQYVWIPVKIKQKRK